MIIMIYAICGNVGEKLQQTQILQILWRFGQISLSRDFTRVISSVWHYTQVQMSFS